jgi:prostaglandin-endoperoxide synthase 2
VTVDLMRKARLRSFNDYREAYGLRPLTSFEELTADTEVANDAFTQALTNPLLARNVFNDATFTKTGMKVIRETQSLQQIIARNSTSPDSVYVNFEVGASGSKHG